MKFCSMCGSEVANTATICPNCGSDVKTRKDSESFVWTIISLFLPVLGAIFYLIWKDDRPLRASSILEGVIAYACLIHMTLLFCIILDIITALTAL